MKYMQDIKKKHVFFTSDIPIISFVLLAIKHKHKTHICVCRVVHNLFSGVIIIIVGGLASSGILFYQETTTKRKHWILPDKPYCVE